ncbi:hypothetical protein PAMP_005489 [Pampus punctatissimus]
MTDQKKKKKGESKQRRQRTPSSVALRNRIITQLERGLTWMRNPADLTLACQRGLEEKCEHRGRGGGRGGGWTPGAASRYPQPSKTATALLALQGCLCLFNYGNSRPPAECVHLPLSLRSLEHESFISILNNVP